jgi:hypothetical protein
MTIVGWRRAALVLGALCLFMQWRACNRPRARAVPCVEEEVARRDEPRDGARWNPDGELSAWDDEQGERGGQAPGARPAGETMKLFGFTIPAWARWFAPQPGENLLAYRDRVVPLAQAAVAPQRARLARSRADLVEKLGLDAQQQAELDAAVSEAASDIQDRVMNAALSGELAPARMKPMAGVRLARDVLQLVDDADQRFTRSLRSDQQGKLAQHPFDVADYLLFSTRWENAIGVK